MSLSELPVVKLVGGGTAFVTGTKSAKTHGRSAPCRDLRYLDPHMPIAL